MIGTIYANSVSDSERTGKSTVHRSFRNLGRSVDGDGDNVDLAPVVSPRGIQHRTSASSPSNQRSLASRSHSSGSCSPADTSTRAKNLTPFSRRERRIGENRSPATEEQQQQQHVVNEHNRSQHHHHHLSSSSDRLYATASADEEVFLARVRQSASPSQKLSDDASQSGVGPSRIRIRSKESLSSGAHGCDHRTGVESPLNPERVHSDSDRGAGGGGSRVESSSFTGSVRLTLKQRSEDLTDDGGGPQKIRTLSTRTNSSTDEFPGVIRAQSKAISYESICLKIKEEAAEKNPKTIQVISLSQPPKFVSASKAVLLGESVTNHGPKDGRNPPCSASQVCDVQFPDAATSSRPVQRDHSIKHRSNVFFSSKKSASGSHTDLSQVEAVHLLPVQMSKVSSLPAKLIKRNAGDVNLKSDLGQSSKILELHDDNKPGKVITLNKKSHDVTLHTSTQIFTKSEDRQKATIIVNAGHVATSDKRLSKMGSTEQPPSHFELSPNRLGKESKFFLRTDQQPRTTDQLIMGTVFTDRHTPRQNLLFPGTDFTPRNNSNSGRTSDTKTSQNSKSVPQAHQIDAAVHDINDQLSQHIDRNPGSFEPSSTSEITNRLVIASGNDDYHVEITSKSATGASKTQGLTSQRQPTMDIVSEGEVSTTRGLAMTEDKREGSTRVDGSFVVRTKDTVVENVLSEDKRVERTEHSVKPDVRVVRGGLARTRSIPSLEIIEENSTPSTTTTTLSSSTNPTSPTKVTTSSRPIISAKEAHNIERASHDDHVSNYTGDAGSLVQTFPKNTVQKETLVDSERLPLLKMAKADSSMVGFKKKTVEKEKVRRVVRFVSQDEMLEYSPTEFRDSGTPSDLPDKKHCSPLDATESDAHSASMEPAAKRFPDAPFMGDSHLKSPRKDPETFEDFLLKFPKKDSGTLEDFLLKSPKKDTETLEDFLLKSPKKDSETLEDFLLKSPRKDPETSRDDASKSSPSAGKTTTTTATTKPCIVRKQLIHLDSALHPSSCVPPDSTPVEAKWSPKLVRKLNLAEAKDVDVSDLDVAPDLMDFLSKEMEKVSVDMKQPDHGETKDELETGTQGIASLSRQRKPPLSLPLPLKSSEREEEDARSSSASAVDINPVKTEPEVGKRKFFSALKANAASFRAKKVPPSADDPSPDPKSNLDRLASFAIISDVGIGAKRRQFQRHKDASLSSISSSGIITEAPSTDAHAKQPTPESPPSATDRIPTKQASFPVLAASGADADKTKTRLVIDDESETRFGTAKGETKARLGSAKARLGKPEVDSDDDFDRLVEINIRELVDETGSARDGPESMEQRMGAKNQTGTGIAGTSGTAGTVGGQEKGQGGRRQLSRFKTQPVTNVEVEKAREMALHPKTNSEN